MSLINPFSWFRRKIDLNDPNSWCEITGQSTYSRRPVTDESAMTVSAFWACVRLLSQAVGTMSFPLYERQEDGGRKTLATHPLYRVVHDLPNADQTAVEFWEGVVLSLCLWGNAVSAKIEAPGVGVVGLRPLHWRRLVMELKNNSWLYHYTDRGRRETFREDQVMHIRGFGFGDGVGLSPLTYARQALGLSMDSEEATAKTFAEGLRAKGFFVTPGNLTPEQRDAAEKVLVDRYSGANAKQAGVLEAGVKFEATNLTLHDAEMLLSRRLSVEEVCRFLGVPPIMIGHAAEGQTTWGSGVEQLLLQFYTTGLRPYLVRIEKAVWRSLIAPKDQSRLYAEFNLDSLFRADTAGRVALWSTYANNGIMTRNEIRERENLPKRPGGDTLTVQSALVPLETIGQTPPAPLEAPAPPAGRRLEVVR